MTHECVALGMFKELKLRTGLIQYSESFRSCDDRPTSDTYLRRLIRMAFGMHSGDVVLVVVDVAGQVLGRAGDRDQPVSVIVSTRCLLPVLVRY